MIHEQQFRLDPKEFADSVIRSQSVSGDNEVEIVKNKLKLYLTSYLIADKFNKLENRAFNAAEIREQDYPKVFKNVRDISIY